METNADDAGERKETKPRGTRRAEDGQEGGEERRSGECEERTQSRREARSRGRSVVEIWGPNRYRPGMKGRRRRCVRERARENRHVWRASTSATARLLYGWYGARREQVRPAGQASLSTRSYRLSTSAGSPGAHLRAAALWKLAACSISAGLHTFLHVIRLLQTGRT